LGARIIAASNHRYGSASQILEPTPPANMGDGWETARARGAGAHQWVLVQLARVGLVTEIACDFNYFIFNNPLTMDFFGHHIAAGWQRLTPRTRVKEWRGSRHSWPLPAAYQLSHVVVRVFPCGGFNRLEIRGEPTTTPLPQVSLPTWLLPA
jgi:allantoicase